MKLAIIYHSVTGNTKKAADLVKAGMEKVDGVSVQCISIEDFKPEMLKDVVGVAIGAPTYYADMSWQMLQFLERGDVNLADKLGCSFATANVPQGGSELVLQKINNLMLTKGMTVYSGGTSHGEPFTHFGANAFVADGGIESKAELFGALGERVATKAAEYFK